MAKPPTIHIEDDEWVTIAWKGQREECCDCGKIHRVDYRVAENGKLQFRARSIRK